MYCNLFLDKQEDHFWDLQSNELLPNIKHGFLRSMTNEQQSLKNLVAGVGIHMCKLELLLGIFCNVVLGQKGSVLNVVCVSVLSV